MKEGPVAEQLREEECNPERHVNARKIVFCRGLSQQANNVSLFQNDKSTQEELGRQNDSSWKWQGFGGIKWPTRMLQLRMTEIVFHSFTLICRGWGVKALFNCSIIGKMKNKKSWSF